MPLRILVLSASVGGGHLRAAQAVEMALRQRLSDAKIHNQDVLELTNAAFRRIYGKAYLDLVNRAPHVLGYFYDLMDRPSRSGKNRGDKLRFTWEKINLRPFTRFLCEEPWDLVINTHFLPAEMIASLRRENTLQVPQVTVTTDFETHRLWVNDPCEMYFTATEEGAQYLHHWGVPKAATRVTGIPVHPVFAEAKPRSECLSRQGLVGDRTVILQLAGGFGVGPIATIYEQLLKIEKPLELVVVAGRNEAVRKKLATISAPQRHRTRLLGFTDQIDELMTVADLIVSKPGGLTTSEALSRGVPLAIVNPIPGQESRNSDFLLENGAAIKVNSIGVLAHKIGRLLDAPERLERLKTSARNLGHPRAAFDVVEESLKLVGTAPSRSSSTRKR